MKKYIGVKVIDAEPMNLGEYNKFRCWTLPADEDPATEGYRVVYPDGYVSWSPKEQFEEAYRETSEGCMSFGLALEALRKGLKVARLGWNGKGMFLFLLPEGQIPIKAINDPALKKVVLDDLSDGGNKVVSEDAVFNALPSIRMWTVNSYGRKGVLTGWLASQTDMLSDDWVIVE